jgi:hypothetical protein
MSNWGDDIRKLNVNNNEASKMELEIAHNIFGNGKTTLYENPNIRVALIAVLLYIFVSLSVVNGFVNKFTKNELFTKILFSVILFAVVYAACYYHHEI